MGLAEWNRFVESAPWVLRGGASALVGDSLAATSVETLDQSEFPSLYELLDRAMATPLVIDDRPAELLTWHAPDGDELGWLCLPPSHEPPAGLFAAHRRLLRSFGGVVERSNEPEMSWLCNCNDALTEREASRDASFLQDWSWMMEGHGGAWPIDLASYYSISLEANGNTTLCNRFDGTVLLFAADHCFDHIDPLEGCPDYSLYHFRSAPDFTGWVEAIARQWLHAIS